MKKTNDITAAVLALLVFGCSEVNDRAGAPGATIASDQCGICHSLPPSDRAHAYHVDTLGYACYPCHLGYAADPNTNTYFVDTLTHMNGRIDVVFSSPWDDSGKAAYDISTEQCSNVYCHGGIPQGTHATVQWNADSIDRSCGACHDLSPNTGDSNSIYTFHYGHALKAFPAIGNKTVGGSVNQCNNCHDSLYSVPNNTVDPLTHINGVFDPGYCGACHLWNTWEEYKSQQPAAKVMSGARAPLLMLPR